MKAVVQRVRDASVTVGGTVVGRISRGLLVYLGVGHGDTERDAAWLADKICGLRIFEDDAGKMNLSVADIGAGVLVVSQFTLLGDARKGRRPSFNDAAPPQLAKALYESFLGMVAAVIPETAAGSFGAMMDVAYVNEGPVTILLDTNRLLTNSGCE
ncbi:MAG: D-tyrosyl-tRNA(Tyr) deacylase [Spirochaetales bacterium]|nr:D-tyrosyl-tRNA(Tyr) deacylase [Spirochaetales bacterium]